MEWESCFLSEAESQESVAKVWISHRLNSDRIWQADNWSFPSATFNELRLFTESNSPCDNVCFSSSWSKLCVLLGGIFRHLGWSVFLFLCFFSFVHGLWMESRSVWYSQQCKACTTSLSLCQTDGAEQLWSPWMNKNLINQNFGCLIFNPNWDLWPSSETWEADGTLSKETKNGNRTHPVQP